MGHVQAQRLDHAGGLLLEGVRHGAEGVGGKQLTRRLQLTDLVVALSQFLGGDVLAVAVFLPHLIEDGVAVGLFIQTDHIVGDLIHHVHRAGADVQHDVVAA